MSDVDGHFLRLARRTALGVIGVGALGFGLWPRKPRSVAEIGVGRTVVDYWEKWTGPEGEAMQRVVDVFNGSQGRIFVRRIPVSDITSKAKVAIGGGDPPDVLGLYSYSVPQFAYAKAAMALDDAALGEHALDASVYAPAVAKLLTFEGRLWGGVSSTYSLALYRNRAMFKEAGLDPDRPPRTVSELDAMSQRFEKRAANGGLERVGFLHTLPAWWPYFWPIMFGGSLFDEASKKVLIASPECVKTYAWVQRTMARLGPDAAAQISGNFSRFFHSAKDPFISGAVPMIVQGPWIANFIRIHRPELDYDASPVPVDDGMYDEPNGLLNAARPTGMLEADVLMIPRGCKHPLEAAEFIKFTQRQEVQEAFCREHAKASPLAKVSGEFLRTHPNRAIGTHVAITQSGAVQVLPQTPVWQAYADLITSAFDKICNGAAVSETLGAVGQRAQQMVDIAETRRA